MLPEFKGLKCCGRVPLGGDNELGWNMTPVQVWAGKKGAFYGGLYQCGSPWVCPMCAAKLGEARKREVQKAIDNALFEGAGVSLVTLTFRHGIGDVLPETLAKFRAALRRCKSGRASKDLRKWADYMGEIRALEITHGRNGWHPHTHALTFTHAPLTGHRLTQYRRRLFVLWYKACEKEGLPLPSYKHGVDVRPASYAADYVSKWGFASEVARPGSKGGRNGSRTPWEILADAGAGDKRSGWLFREYAHGMKGCNQLLWSRGLAERLSVKGQLTDQEALDLKEVEDAEVITTIDRETWGCVLAAGAQEAVLAAAVEGRAALFGLLNELRRRSSRLPPREDWER